MTLHDRVFWAIVFFLAGILFASALAPGVSGFASAILAAAVIAAALSAFRKFLLAALSAFFALGGCYTLVREAWVRDVILPQGKAEFEAVVLKVRMSPESQLAILKLQSPYRGLVALTASRYPAWQYGDRLEVAGGVEPVPPDQGFFKKQNIAATIRFPQTARIGEGEGMWIKAKLFELKASIEESFSRLLPGPRAAFLSGLLLGDTGEFSDEFREKLSRTGTSHLVALSGYNVAIVAKAAMATLGFFLARRATIGAAAIVILLFVVMTGAEASVVRAAIMAAIVLLAEQSGKIYRVRNAIAVAAFVMTLAHPRVLVWDLGFQLSFAALLGIVYVKPALARLLRVSASPGFLGWRENLLATASAQLAVLPILLSSFGIFSPLALIPNVLILGFVPLTMALGTLLAGLAFFGNYVALAAALPLNALLGYEMRIIDMFSEIGGSIQISRFGIVAALVYYGILAGYTSFLLKKPSHAGENG